MLVRQWRTHFSCRKSAVGHPAVEESGWVAPGGSGVPPWIGMALCAAALVAGSAAFLPQQSIWVDEATQLSGLQLGPLDVVRWLAGADRRDFGQFRDRMPPLSYWLGWCWAQAFGRQATALRWLGVLYTAGAAALIYAAARRAFGPSAGWVGGLSFALSPAVVVMAVEIRAYPLLLLCSAGAYYFLLRTLNDATPRARDVIGLAATLAAGILTHFFGLVLAGGVLITLTLFAVTRRGRWASVFAVGGVVAVAAASIIPFIRESVAASRVPPSGTRVVDQLLATCRLLPGLTSHPAIALFPPAEALCAAAAVVLGLVALVPLGRRRRAQAAVVLVLTTGLTAVAAAKVAMTSFDAARPTYNAWIWPGISLLLASGLGCLRPRAWRVASIAAGVLIAGLGIGVVQLGRHGTSFAHTPSGSIARMIRELGEGDVAIIHDDPSHHLVHISGPLYQEFGPFLKQYHLDRSSLDRRPPGLLTCEGVRLGRSEVGPSSVLSQPVIVVIHSQNTPPGALVDRIRRGTRFEGDGPIARELLSSPSWKLVDRRSAHAEHSADILVFRRVGRDDLPRAQTPAVTRGASAPHVRLDRSRTF